MHPAVYTIPVPDLDRARKELHVKVQSAQGNVLLSGRRRHRSMEILISSHRSENHCRRPSPSPRKHPSSSSICKAYFFRRPETQKAPAKSTSRCCSAIRVTSRHCSRRPSTHIARQITPPPSASSIAHQNGKTKIPWSLTLPVLSTAQKAGCLSPAMRSGRQSTTAPRPCRVCLSQRHTCSSERSPSASESTRKQSNCCNKLSMGIPQTRWR